MKDWKNFLARLDVFPLNVLFALGVVGVLCLMSLGMAPLVFAALGRLVALDETFPEAAVVWLFILLRLAVLPYALVYPRKGGAAKAGRPLDKKMMGWRRFVMPVVDSVTVFLIIRATVAQGEAGLPFLDEDPVVTEVAFIGFCICMNVCLPLVMWFPFDICFRLWRFLWRDRSGDFVVSSALADAAGCYVAVCSPAFLLFALESGARSALGTALLALFTSQLFTTPIPVAVSLWLDQRRRHRKAETGQP